jgi:predicted transcriptional regulator
MPDGSSHWVVEQRFPLGPAEPEIPENLSETLSTRAVEYRERLSVVVEEASRLLGREMSLENVSTDVGVVETISGRMGVIRVSFIWRGFAKSTQPGALEVGDIFIGGLYLSEGESLRIYMPEGYILVEARPRPDDFGERYVGWSGRRIFADGEPHLLASPTKTPGAKPGASAEEPSIWTIALGTALLGGSAALAAGLRRRRSARPLLRGDVEAVLEALRRRGGSAYQSQLARECGLPKSTLSAVLRVLESEGRVVREAVGREKLVRLSGRGRS